VAHKEHSSCCFRQLSVCELRDLEIKGSIAEQEFAASENSTTIEEPKCAKKVEWYQMDQGKEHCY
jgi:hypothetical protein